MRWGRVMTAVSFIPLDLVWRGDELRPAAVRGLWEGGRGSGCHGQCFSGGEQMRRAGNTHKVK